MQSARARDQLPPTMDHKGTVEISSEYHAVGGMGMRAAGSHLTYERHLSMQEMRFFLDSVQSGNQLHVWLPVFTSQHRTNQERLTKSSVHQQALDYSRLYLPTITNTCYRLPELTRVGTSWYQEYSITTG